MVEIKQKEKEKVIKCYLDMYYSMIKKDIRRLNEMLDDSFTLTHLTGMEQNKKEFITSIELGTLRYYSVQVEQIDIEEDIDTMKLIGKSRVEASVFGGTRNTWSLQLSIKLKKNYKNFQWQIIEAVAETY